MRFAKTFWSSDLDITGLGLPPLSPRHSCRYRCKVLHYLVATQAASSTCTSQVFLGFLEGCLLLRGSFGEGLGQDSSLKGCSCFPWMVAALDVGAEAISFAAQLKSSLCLLKASLGRFFIQIVKTFVRCCLQNNQQRNECLKHCFLEGNMSPREKWKTKNYFCWSNRRSRSRASANALNLVTLVFMATHIHMHWWSCYSDALCLSGFKHLVNRFKVL